MLGNPVADGQVRPDHAHAAVFHQDVGPVVVHRGHDPPVPNYGRSHPRLPGPQAAPSVPARPSCRASQHPSTACHGRGWHHHQRGPRAGRRLPVRLRGGACMSADLSTRATRTGSTTSTSWCATPSARRWQRRAPFSGVRIRMNRCAHARSHSSMHIVMPGLDPGISLSKSHPLLGKHVDGRVKPGHDEKWWRAIGCARQKQKTGIQSSLTSWAAFSSHSGRTVDTPAGAVRESSTLPFLAIGISS